MAALLTLHPPKGGQPVTLDMLRHAVADRGIVHGVLEAAMAEAVEQGRSATVMIAQGTPPTRGTPTRFESLLDRLKPRAQEIDELAPRDARDLGSLLLVLGVFSMFYIRDRRVWIWGKPHEGGSSVMAAMTSQKRAAAPEEVLRFIYVDYDHYASLVAEGAERVAGHALAGQPVGNRRQPRPARQARLDRHRLFPAAVGGRRLRADPPRQRDGLLREDHPVRHRARAGGAGLAVASAAPPDDRLCDRGRAGPDALRQ
ncbi:hypothetical protein G6F24_014257 [Rhizopus arrhizus]|nr:hypothetical protein G6F24_014257 [Rhizopus arrhizus]